ALSSPADWRGRVPGPRRNPARPALVRLPESAQGVPAGPADACRLLLGRRGDPGLPILSGLLGGRNVVGGKLGGKRGAQLFHALIAVQVGQGEPEIGAPAVLPDAQSLGIAYAEPGLRRRITLAGGGAHPAQGLLLVVRYAA